MLRVAQAAARRGGLASRAGNRRGFATLIAADADPKLGMAPATLSVLGAVQKYEKGDVHFFATTKECAAETAKLGKTFLAEGAQTADVIADTITKLVKENGYTHVAGSISTVNKDSLPRVGAAFDVQPIADVIEVKSEDTFVRPIYAGNALATVQSSDSLKIMTVRPTNFEPSAGGTAGDITEIAAEASSTGIEFVSESVKVSDKPQLGTAKRVVSGGRSLASSENFETVSYLDCECASFRLCNDGLPESNT